MRRFYFRNSLLWLFMLLLTLSCGKDSKKSSPIGPDEGNGTETPGEISGAIELTSGSTLKSDELNVVTFSDETSISSSGDFNVETPEVEKNQVLFVTSRVSDKPVYLGIRDPETNEISVDSNSTALALTLFNPFLFGSDKVMQEDYLLAVKNSSKYSDLVTLLNDAYKTDADLALDYDTNPDVYQLAVDIMVEVSGTLDLGVAEKRAAYPKPYIENNTKKVITFGNPTHVWYGAGIYPNDEDLGDVVTISRKEKIVSLSMGDVKTDHTLSDGYYRVFLSKGDFEFENFTKWGAPEGRATILNTTQSLIYIIEAGIGNIPYFNEKLAAEFPNKVKISSALLFNMSEAIGSGDKWALFNALLDVLEENKDNIVQWLWSEAGSKKTEKAIEAADKYVSHLSGFMKKFSIIFKMAGWSNEQVPFIWDMIGAPSKVTYYVTLENGTLISTDGYFTFSGKILDAGSGLAGVTITISGNDVTTTITTDSEGSYGSSQLKAGTYSVSLNMEGYTFSQDNFSVYLSDSDVSIPDITATQIPQTYTITGRVLESGSGLSSVAVTMGSETTTTGSDGSYSFTDVADGSYTLAFTKNSYVFTQSTKEVTVSGADVTVDDVTAKEYIEGEPPDLLAYELSPAKPEVKPGESFTACFQINNPNSASMAVNLDVRWRSSSGAYGEFEPTTYSVTLEPGTDWYERTCTVPDDLEAGSYAVAWYLLETDNSLIEESGYIDNSATVIGGGGGGGGSGDTDITFVTIPAVTTPYEMASGYTVTLSTYEMSETEVTNAQYAKYLNEALASGDIEVTSGDAYGKTGDWAGQRYLDIAGNDNLYPDNECKIVYSNGTFSVKSGYENWPVTWVTWYGSKAFAEYHGYDLPTEAESQYAATGGMNYEYGTDDGTFGSSKANYDKMVGHPTDVGSYPENPFGLFDMSGNLWEWCIDWLGGYPNESANDPTGALTGSERVIRGGCWNNSANGCRSAFRYGGKNPGGSTLSIGFRVVRR